MPRHYWMWGPAMLLGLVLVGCAEGPDTYEDHPPLSRQSGEVIDLHMAYPQAFHRVVRLLEKEGYEVKGDERTGLIRTAPKVREGSDGVAYKVAVVIRMGGNDHESWLAVDQIAIPTFPEDEKRLKDALKGLGE